MRKASRKAPAQSAWSAVGEQPLIKHQGYRPGITTGQSQLQQNPNRATESAPAPHAAASARGPAPATLTSFTAPPPPLLALPPLAPSSSGSRSTIASGASIPGAWYATPKDGDVCAAASSTRTRPPGP